MNRRQFVSTSGAAAAALTTIPSGPAAAAPKRALMKLGCQTAPTNEQHLRYLARYGAEGICAYPEIAAARPYGTVEGLTRMRNMAEKSRTRAGRLPPPFL